MGGGGEENWHLLLTHRRYIDKPTNLYRNVLCLRSPLPIISFLSKPLNLIGCHGNQKAWLYPGIRKYGMGRVPRVYRFRLSVRPFVCLLVPASIQLHMFTLKFLKWLITWQPLTRKLRYLEWDIGTLKGLPSFHKFWSQGSCPGVGAGGQNQGHLKSVLYYVFCYTNPLKKHQVRHKWSSGCWLLGPEVKVRVAYISRSSDFA